MDGPHGSYAREQVNAVVVDSGWRKALGLVEEVAVLLQETSQQGLLGLGCGHRQLWVGHC